MAYELPPIAKLAERLHLNIEQAVRNFPRYHKYAIGKDMRKQARKIVRLCHRAWRDRGQQLKWVDALVWAIDELKLSLQMGSQIKAFKSFAQFEGLIRLGEEIGKQAGGWKRQLIQHPKGQNSTRNAAAERAQILSTCAASTGANL
ncbi:MAG TPA: four helix bundle protein [Pseudoxanthomonas sp.]|nr:four helix bundle protein [Pseudoxanthomonas sp.]